MSLHEKFQTLHKSFVAEVIGTENFGDAEKARLEGTFLFGVLTGIEMLTETTGPDVQSVLEDIKQRIQVLEPIDSDLDKPYTPP